ncbi:MAG: hypothetical protein DRJ11_05175 [Candidatus Aminicenantes bacterium]|nr:MAG: hypothetical protein DRJ11_05175 [Candidatus Aminicenantes bacterium]
MIEQKIRQTGPIWGLVLVLELLFLGLETSWSRTLHQKIAGEFILRRESFILRFRPVDYTWPASLWKCDLLLGRRFGRFVGYGYFKAAGRHSLWLGLRFGLNTKIMANRLRTIAQVRVFLGLNNSSPPHYYLIPALFYGLGRHRKIEIGFLGYEKQSQGQAPTFMLGPAVIIPLFSHIKSRFYWGENLSGKGRLIYFKFYFYL